MEEIRAIAEPIRVLIADDHEILRKGLCALLKTRPSIQVIGEAADGIQAVKSANELQPDVILMDLVMPYLDGTEAIRRIRMESPEARVLVLTSFAEDEKLVGAIESGALGYVLKEASPKELIQAIHDVYEGRSYLNATLTLRLMHYMARQTASGKEPQLTPRETDVLRLLAQGLANREIATSIIISERSAANYVASILSKLGLANRTQAALYAVRHGYAELPQDPTFSHF